MAPTEQRWPSNAEKDLEARRQVTEKGEVDEVYTPFAVEGNDTSAYFGVSTEYRTYANDTEKPMRSEEGVEADLEAEALNADAPLLESARVVGEPESSNATPAGVVAQTAVSDHASGVQPGSDGPASTPVDDGTPTEEKVESDESLTPPAAPKASTKKND